eukprot:evm.model.scf_1173.2 EVM.evm.TU.scf_1173.2   scf_1173:6722-7150(-)
MTWCINESMVLLLECDKCQLRSVSLPELPVCPSAEPKKTRGVGRKARTEKDDKGEKKTRRGGGGFAKPLKVSTELADFLGSAEISRPQLTKFMWDYFKSNGLQNPDNKQEIIADGKLQALMKVDRFRGFGFMKHLKPHILEN